MEQVPFPLEALSDDLLIAVFESLIEMCRYSLEACTGVCHRFYRLGIPIKYRNVHVFNSSSCSTTKRLRNKGSQLPLFVRMATLDDRRENGSNEADPFLELLRATKCLKEIIVYGSYQFSQPVLDLISSLYPHCGIEYHAGFPREEDGWYDGWGSAGPLAGGMDGFRTSQLRSLHLDGMWAVENDGQPVVRRSLEKIVKNSPNLRHLTTYDSNWYGTFDGVKQVLDLNLTGSERLPTLETFEYVPVSVDTLRTWGAVTRWASLRVLKVSQVDLVPIFTAYGLPLLSSLTIARSHAADVFDGLPELRAPVRFLCITIEDDHLPLKFLAQFTDTLAELMLLRKRKSSVRGYRVHEVQRFNETCPQLRKLYIRPYVDETTLEWPHEFLAELGRFENLECLILGQENYSKLQPSADLCIGSYNTVRGDIPFCKLRQLGLIHEYESNSCPDFRALISRARFICVAAMDGPKIPERKEEYFEYGTYSKCCREAEKKALEERPFSRKLSYIWGTRSEADVVWTMKQLGPGLEWAVKELLPRGLVRQKHIDDTWTPANDNYREEIAKIVKAGEGLDEYRSLMVEELKYWNCVWDRQEKYGCYYSLYDVLYPREEET